MNGPSPERWTYIGQRQADVQKHRTWELWTDGDGKELWYANLGGSVIGGTYTVQVDRSEGRTRVSGMAKFVEEAWDGPPSLAALQAIDQEARRKVQAVKAERSLARKTDALDEAMAELEATVVGCRTWEDARAVMGAVQERLLRAWDDRSNRR